MLVAYKGDEKLKAKYVKRVKAHYDADEIAKGYYWENGKGCAVGCTIEGDDHEKYETELGIPEILAHLEDSLFESMNNGDAKEFPLRFLKAIKPGADLSLVVPKLVVWQFEDAKYGLKNIQEVKDDKELYESCEEIVALCNRKIAGEIVANSEFQDLYERRDRAWAGVRAWAWAWVRAWAWAWAGLRAWAGVRAWAWAWAGLRVDYQKNIKITADKLISLLEEAPLAITNEEKGEIE